MLAIANKAEESRCGATGGESESGGGGEGEDGEEDAEEGKESEGRVMAASCQLLSCLRAFVTKCSGQKGKPGAPMDAKV